VPLDPAADEVALEVAARMILEAFPANPLAILADLRLDDAINVRRYGEAALRFEEREHRQELAVAGDIVTVVANARDRARTGSLLSFEPTSTIRAGRARGTLRPVRDGEGKARSIDQRARLEAVYARAKELGMAPLDAAAGEELRGLRHEVCELRYVWRGEVVHALRTLRDPPPVNRMNARFPGTRVRHAAMHDGLREAEPFLVVLPDELAAWDDMTDLLQAKAQTIGYKELTAEPYIEAVREVVRVYRGGGETSRLGDAPADRSERA
jgi:hypothetical protein